MPPPGKQRTLKERDWRAWKLYPFILIEDTFPRVAAAIVRCGLPTAIGGKGKCAVARPFTVVAAEVAGVTLSTLVVAAAMGSARPRPA